MEYNIPKIITELSFGEISRLLAGIDLFLFFWRETSTLACPVLGVLTSPLL
jgi:hypothetical protein